LDSISGATNARSGCFFLLERAESVSNPKYKGFSDFLEFAGGGARVQNSPVVAIALISADAWHGDSTAAMTALFSCSQVLVRTSGWERDSSLRSLDSVGVEAWEGQSRRVRCKRINRQAKWNFCKIRL
jgi:hypothetical protein